MPTLPFVQNNFAGGLNTKDAAYLLVDTESRDLQNVQGSTSGAITKRNGNVTHATAPEQLWSLFAAEGSTELLIAAGQTTLYKVTGGGVVTSIKSGLAGPNKWSWVQAPVVAGQGAYYGMNGFDTPQQWDGAAASTSNWTNASGAVAVPNGKYSLYANNQVFVAGVTATPSTVYWSAIADPTNWDPASLTGAGSVQFDPNDGQAITGIGRVGPYILVCKPRKLWVLVDPASASSRRLSDNVGCVAHRSIAAGPSGTYFLSEDRVYLTNGSSLKPISDKIQPTLASNIDPTNSAGVCFNSHYYLSITTSGASNNTTLDWDESLQSWWLHTFGETQFAIWHRFLSTDRAELFGAKGSVGAIVDRCFGTGITVDNGVPFKWRWAGPWISPSFYRRRFFPTPHYRKRLRQLRYDGLGTVDVSLATDFAAVETLIRSNVFSASATITRGRQYSLPVANAFSVVFSSTSSTADQVLSYTGMFTDRVDSVT